MYKINFLGEWESVPEAVAAICDHDVSKLEKLINEGLNINESINISKNISDTLLNVAIYQNEYEIIKFLISHGVKDNDSKNPAILKVARFCGPEVVTIFIDQARKLNTAKRLELFQEIYLGNHHENFSVFEEIGITIKKYGGQVLSEMATPF